jgi:hypothetical protein
MGNAVAKYADCIRRIASAAGRDLTDDETAAVFERVHKAALDVRAGRVDGTRLRQGTKVTESLGKLKDGALIIQEAAQRAAADLEAEAAKREKQAELQLIRLGARQGDVERLVATGLNQLDAIEKTIARDYSGRLNVESLEQKATGYRDYFNRKMLETWDALGNDFLGFFQDREKLLDLVRELRGEDTGNALAKKGAKAFHDVAEEARQVFNANGGVIGKLDDWGMPQHHSQEKVAAAGKDAWTETILPMLDRGRYLDEYGQPMDDAKMREFLSHAWDTIATNGHANTKAGGPPIGGKRANRHAEERQIHFKDAESVIEYWNEYGERTAVEILSNHVDTMARDIAFVEHFGPNPDTTYQTLRDQALTAATLADPTQTPTLEGRAVKLDLLYDYAAGRMKPTYRQWLRKTADGIANLNVAGKLGGAAIASFFGDKPMMEAVSHLNDIPAMQRWGSELRLLNPKNAADRRLIQTQGLMVDSIRSGLQRFYEGLGQSGFTGRLANAVMRISGMQAINDIRKGAFGLNAMAAIGDQLAKNRAFSDLDKTDVRLLKTWGITERDWSIWQLAKLDTMVGVDNVLTPEGISRITDADLQKAGITAQVQGAATDIMTEGAQARRDAIVKLLGIVNTESEFAIVTPGWKERSTFYGSLQRGTVPGEMWRSMLQFKAFPWAMFQRSMDAVANQDTPTSKAIMTSYLIVSTTMAGAMLMQTRELLTGKDPLDMTDKKWWKFWGKAFLQGGALGLYGDFLYNSATTRTGSGVLETMSGPTMGPLLEIGLVQPMAAIAKNVEGKESHLAAQTLHDLKGYVPGGNLWYTKAAMDHLVWQRVLEMASPGYLAQIRQRTQRDFNQEWWWNPGETTPDRGPEFGRAIGR